MEDLVVLVVAQTMVVLAPQNHQQVIISHPQMQLQILQQMDGDIQVEQDIPLEIVEVAVVLEVLVKMLIHLMLVMVEQVCNFLQHSGILHKVLEHQDQQIHLHIIQDGLI